MDRRQRQMTFHETRVPGVFKIQIEPKPDERGFLARCWRRNEFEGRGFDSNLMECSLSFNARKGALRGAHYQSEPRALMHGCTRPPFRPTKIRPGCRHLTS
jgi:dTDP-4-dehydrorhamnose 3,5-epimerase